jgi:hypothetical protein
MRELKRSTTQEDDSGVQLRRTNGIMAILIILVPAGVFLGFMLWYFYLAAR